MDIECDSFIYNIFKIIRRRERVIRDCNTRLIIMRKRSHGKSFLWIFHLNILTWELYRALDLFAIYIRRNKKKWIIVVYYAASIFPKVYITFSIIMQLSYTSKSRNLQNFNSQFDSPNKNTASSQTFKLKWILNEAGKSVFLSRFLQSSEIKTFFLAKSFVVSASPYNFYLIKAIITIWCR